MTSGTEWRRWRGADEGNEGSSVEVKGSGSLCNFGFIFVVRG